MNNLIFDCQFGVSGDMLVGALLSLGASKKVLKSALKSLNLGNYKIEISNIKKQNYNATDFNVMLDNNNFDHDMQYLYENNNVKVVKLVETRNLEDVTKIIDNSNLTPSAKNTAKNIFEIIANAEAEAHKIKLEEVNFHETGAMDSIIDIVSVAVCLDNLKVSKVYVTNLNEGVGFINTRVGKLPIPTPAVKNIAERFKIKLNIIDFKFELITPTGLGALAAISKFESVPDNYKILKTGYGAGKRNYNTPCTLKALLIS